MVTSDEDKFVLVETAENYVNAVKLAKYIICDSQGVPVKGLNMSEKEALKARYIEFRLRSGHLVQTMGTDEQGELKILTREA